MVCNFKRFFCLLAAVVLAFSCMGALAATPTAPPAEPEGLTTQIQALEDYLAKNSTTNGNGWKVYPEGFAGYYATDGGTKLTLCMTDASDPTSQGLRSLAAQYGIPLKKAEYSMNDLIRFQNAVGPVTLLDEIGIAGIGIDTVRNCVVVDIVKLDAQKEALFRGKISDSPVYVLESVGGYIQPTDEADKSGVVTAKSLIVRAKPMAASKRVGTFKKGDSVSITGEDKGWWKIDFNGRMGYVSKKYVEVQP